MLGHILKGQDGVISYNLYYIKQHNLPIRRYKVYAVERKNAVLLNFVRSNRAKPYDVEQCRGFLAQTPTGFLLLLSGFKALLI
jgi:hypothetical protein